MSKAKFYITAAALLFFSSEASALTFTENGPSSGEFSKRYEQPTVIPFGYEIIEGRGRVNGTDFLRLNGLPKGAQELTFTFTAPEHVGRRYATGGQIYWADSPFAAEWDGVYLGSHHLDYWTRFDEVVLSLPTSFDGDLWVGLYFTYGNQVAYTLAAPRNAHLMPAVPTIDLPVYSAGTAIHGDLATLPAAALSTEDNNAPTEFVAAIPLPAPALLFLGGITSLMIVRKRR